MKEHMNEQNNNLLISVFKSEKTIDSQLPVSFKSGYQLKDFEAKCDCCSATLKGDLVKGSVFKIDENSRFDFWDYEKISNNNSEDGVDKIMVDAVGFCPQCVAYTHCSIHIKDKGLSPQEAEEREKFLELQRKANSKKTFFGLSIETVSKAKSMKSKRDADMALLAKKQLDEKNRKLKEELDKKAEKEKLSLNSIKKNNSIPIGQINENMVDMNEVARHRLQELKQSQTMSNVDEAFKVGIAETVVVKNTVGKNTVSENKEPVFNAGSMGNLGVKKENAVSKKLHDVMSGDAKEYKDAVDSNQVTLTSKAKRQLELMKQKPVVSQEVPKTASMLLRGNASLNEISESSIDNNETQDEFGTDLDEDIYHNSSNNGSKKRKFVQRSNSLTQRLMLSIKNIFSVLEKIKEKKSAKNNDLLRNYKYVKPTTKGGVSAHERLLALRKNNDEFVSKAQKVKKHNHDSFK